MRKRNELISAISPLKPISVINTQTGEYVSYAELEGKIGQVIHTVQTETQRLYDQNKTALFTELTNYKGTPQPAEYARQKGYLTNYRSTLPREVLAKSRLEKLVQYKLISESASYVLNPNPAKQEPLMSPLINLGAVDSQMASLSQESTELNLLWKCWDTEYYITFQLPAYILKRKIIKFSLPIVKRNKKTQQVEFIFNLFEEIRTRKGHAHTVGIDLGKVKPYSMAVVNERGSRVASYESSPRLTRLSQKRERLINETRALNARVKNRAIRGLASPQHLIEYERKRDKTTRLTTTITAQTGSEITRKLIKHNSNLIKLENLSWVSGNTNSKVGSSRWSHSFQQAAITHATTRIGYRTKKVSAYNTSQVCHVCHGQVTHVTRSRVVRCVTCQSQLDRDFNAAMNIAKQPLPASKKLNRGTTLRTSINPIGIKEALIGIFANNLSTLTRKTT